MSTDLMVELAALSEEAPAYLLTEFGKPFKSSGSLYNRVRKRIIQVGLCRVERGEDGKDQKKATRSQHGIRKARAEEIAEQGGFVYEVMAVLSHRDEKTAAIYTKKFERKKLIEKAVARLRTAV